MTKAQLFELARKSAKFSENQEVNIGHFIGEVARMLGCSPVEAILLAEELSGTPTDPDYVAAILDKDKAAFERYVARNPQLPPDVMDKIRRTIEA